MGLSKPLLLCFALLLTATTSVASFAQRFKVVWGQQHLGPRQFNAPNLQMVLDERTGSAIESYDRYVYGYISMNIKLVPKNSAGVVTTFYMSSKGPAHDELDLEFLGNVTGQPYILHTNIYVNGVGGREVRVSLWFDPAADYHKYALLWNSRQVVFFVDDVPIRVLRKTPTTPFPQQPMYVYSSIWDASSWATRGGLDKIDWAAAPFIASFASYGLNDTCNCSQGMAYPSACVSNSWRRWWNQPPAWTLSPQQRAAYSWARTKFTVYDYCTDRKRYPTPPPECHIPPW